MPSPAESYGRFFETLVGDEARVTALKGKLAASVNTYQGDNFCNTLPYARLGLAMARAIDETAFQDVGFTAEDETDLGLGSGNPLNIALNGEMAMQRTVSVLETVGNIYAAKAKVPQQVDRVKQSAELALLQLYGMAFMDRTITGVNLAAYQRGLNSRSRFHRFLLTNFTSIKKTLDTPPLEPSRFHCQSRRGWAIRCKAAL
ncbi:MAG TPA: hypothetical protein VIJ68_02865 [Candidatus Saccharimonadales bacterium]